MRNFTALFFACFLTLSAFANSTTSPAQIQNSSEEIVLVSHVDFNKMLNMVILDTEVEGFTLKLEDHNGNEIFRTQVRTGDSEVVEIDLSDIDGGTYQLKFEGKDTEQTESVIVPYN
ncbi:MAG: hypothetical protein AAGA10_01320 [Bacteroidota bacterium]